MYVVADIGIIQNTEKRPLNLEVDMIVTYPGIECTAGR
jgi:hypothetical protein